MGDMIGQIFAELEKLLPERYRVRVISCTAFLGLCAWIWYSDHNFAQSKDVTAAITSAVAPLTSELKADEDVSDRHYLQDLSSQILQAAGRCKETKSEEAQDLYRSNLVQLLERYQSTAKHPYPQDVSCN